MIDGSCDSDGLSLTTREPGDFHINGWNVEPHPMEQLSGTLAHRAPDDTSQRAAAYPFAWKDDILMDVELVDEGEDLVHRLDTQ